MPIDRSLPRSDTIRRRRAILALLATGALGSALSGCGGGSGSSGAASRADKAQQAGLDFARCMREHGVDVADPKPGGDTSFQIGGSGANQAKLKQAEGACSHFLKAAVTRPKPADQRKIIDAALKWAACMRRNGVDVKDPTAGQGGMIKIGPGPSTNVNDPAFKRADAKCRSLLPGPGPAPVPNPGGASGGEVGQAPAP